MKFSIFIPGIISPEKGEALLKFLEEQTPWEFKEKANFTLVSPDVLDQMESDKGLVGEMTNLEGGAILVGEEMLSYPANLEFLKQHAGIWLDGWEAAEKLIENGG